MSMPVIAKEALIGAVVLQVLLAVVVLARRTWRSYPAFSAYVFFSVLESGVIAVMKHQGIQGKIYFYTFFALEAIGIVLGLAVVREVFTNLFSPHPALRKLAIVIFRVAVVALVV